MIHDRAEALADQVTQLRRELSLAEEGLANYAQENERLKFIIDQAAPKGWVEAAQAKWEILQESGLHPTGDPHTK